MNIQSKYSINKKRQSEKSDYLFCLENSSMERCVSGLNEMSYKHPNVLVVRSVGSNPTLSAILNNKCKRIVVLLHNSLTITIETIASDNANVCSLALNFKCICLTHYQSKNKS